jgi:pimeloyl-ACP methyl ester carboxylesterase
VGFPLIARYPAAGPSLWGFDRLPPDTRVEPVPFRAEDGGESHGTLYTRGGERVVACLMHPRGDMQRHYAMPALLEAGIACFGQAGRFLNNDINLIHEQIIVDVAAALRWLTRERGFEKVILLGNSGGGALYTFYQSQALAAPAERLKDTAAGDPFDLGRFEMRAADGMVQLATHLGQGRLMLSIIDPSVTDENDPLSCDPSLDMYDARNGFRPLPESSKYSAEFLERYRVAQVARTARIDAIARGMLEEQAWWRRRLGAPDFDALPLAEQQWILRRSFVGRYFEVHRTEANPAYTDLALWPSRRQIGSFFSPRPDVFNYLEAGFGKYQTPRAWLSTWSGLSSRASTLECIERIPQPTLVIAYDGDNTVFSYHTDSIHQASPARDKAIHRVPGDHLGFGPGGFGDRSGQAAALEIIVAWIRERFC